MKEISVNLNAEGLKFGIVVSRFNDFLTKQLLGGRDRLPRAARRGRRGRHGGLGAGRQRASAGRRPAGRHGRRDALIALGAVVQGATPHAGLINAQVSRSLAHVALSKGVPVINGVVCADNLEQAIERSGTKAGNKGWHAAQAAIEMANLYKALA